MSRYTSGVVRQSRSRLICTITLTTLTLSHKLHFPRGTTLQLPQVSALPLSPEP
uniref:Uncharacterized protein n=1 Tax=Anguilla anguilla TaxID=7936 RepID=A0A0E9ULH7_ANGAN